MSQPESRGEYQSKFYRGLEQFNGRLFFDAHETWEEIWLSSPEPDKTFLQGIIQVAAAFHHYGNANLRGTRTLLEAGLRRLGSFPDVHHGIQLELLRQAARDWTVALAGERDPGTAKVPLIHLSESRLSENR